MTSSRRIVSIAFLAVVLASCGGGSSSKKASGSNSPLEDLFGGGDEFKARQRKVEESISTCMRDKGWKYVPVDFDQAFGQVADNPDFSDPDKFRAKYGYGISTSPDFGGNGGGEFKDPNNDYVQGLTEAEQQQYYKDLDGAFFSSEPIEGDAPPTTTVPTGCRADGERAAGNSVFNDPKFNEVYGRLAEQQENDPRFAEAETKWATCMKDAGYSYSKVNEPVTDIQEQFFKLQGVDFENGIPQATIAGATSVSTAVAIPIEGDGGIGGGPPSSIDPAALKKIQDLELATAKADGACQKKHIEKVSKQLQQELYDQLVSEFPELKK
jgi:hypothetical protein